MIYSKKLDPSKKIIFVASQNINQILSFVHEFERQDLMNKGDKVFTITYLLGYALTNSHHSIDYMNSSEDDDYAETSAAGGRRRRRATEFRMPMHQGIPNSRNSL